MKPARCSLFVVCAFVWSAAVASDVVITLPQEALTQFALALGPVTGTINYTYFIRAPQLVASELVTAAGGNAPEAASIGERVDLKPLIANKDNVTATSGKTARALSTTGPTSPRVIAQPLRLLNPRHPDAAYLRAERIRTDIAPRADKPLGAKAIAYVPKPLGTIHLTWTVVHPSVAITSAGARLNGFFAVSDGTMSTLEPFSVAATISAQVSGSTPPGAQFQFSADNEAIAIHWPVAGRIMQVGTVELGQYYSATQDLQTRDIAYAGRSINPAFRTLALMYLPGSVQISADLQF